MKKPHDQEKKADEKPLEERDGAGRKKKKRCEPYFEAGFGLQHLFIACPPRIFSVHKPRVLPTVFPKGNRRMKISLELRNWWGAQPLVLSPPPCWNVFFLPLSWLLSWTERGGIGHRCLKINHQQQHIIYVHSLRVQRWKEGRKYHANQVHTGLGVICIWFLSALGLVLRSSKPSFCLLINA